MKDFGRKLWLDTIRVHMRAPNVTRNLSPSREHATNYGKGNFTLPLSCWTTLRDPVKKLTLLLSEVAYMRVSEKLYIVVWKRWRSEVVVVPWLKECHAPIGEFQQHFFLGKYTQCPLSGKNMLMYLSRLSPVCSCNQLSAIWRCRSTQSNLVYRTGG